MQDPKKQDANKRISIKDTLEKSRIMPQAIKDKSNSNRIIIIVVLVLLPVLIGLLSYLA